MATTRSKFLIASIFTAGLFLARATFDVIPPIGAQIEAQKIQAGYDAVDGKLKSFEFTSQRTIRLNQQNARTTQKDNVLVRKDDGGSLFFKKEVSGQPETPSFYWVNSRLYRPDQKVLVHADEAKGVWLPLLKNNSHYWQELTERFGDHMKWEMAAEKTWQNRKCLTYKVSNLNPPGPTQPSISGEVLLDPEWEVVLKSSLKIQYTQKNLENKNPYQITVELHEKVNKPNALAKLDLPKEFLQKLEELEPSKPSKPKDAQ